MRLRLGEAAIVGSRSTEGRTLNLLDATLEFAGPRRGLDSSHPVGRGYPSVTMSAASGNRLTECSRATPAVVGGASPLQDKEVANPS